MTSFIPILSSEPRGRRHAQVVPGPGSIDSSATSNGCTESRSGQAGGCGAPAVAHPFDVALESEQPSVTSFSSPLTSAARLAASGRAVPAPDGVNGMVSNRFPPIATVSRFRVAPCAADQERAPSGAGTAGAADRSFVNRNAYRMTHGQTVAAGPRWPINGPIPEAPRKATPHMSQRSSDPQLLAVALDEVLPLVIDKLEADGERDAGDEHIIRTLRAVSDGQLRHAEIFDLTASINRIGLTKRNRQKVRELFPELAG
jgi:hypothetical protein